MKERLNKKERAMFRKVKFLWFIEFVICGIISYWASNEILSWFGKDIPWYADLIVGFVTSTLSVPVAVVGVILRAFGVF